MKKYKYPVITEENFEEMTNRLVTGSSKYVSNQRLRVRKPRTRNEFYEMTKNMYGMGLTLERCGTHFYEIKENFDVYSKTPIGKLWDEKYSQYDGLKIFLNTAFGRLGTGGVAGRHYGDFKCGYRSKKRISNMDSSVLRIRSSNSSN